MSRVCAFLILVLCCVGVSALDFPPALTQHVNDYAGILTAEQKQDLDSIVSQEEEQTSNQIIVAIFPSLEEESLEDFTNRLFIKWGVGQKTHNNGALIALFLKERKVRIEVGYGLEGKLTDALSSQIVRNEMAPEFREGKYYEGLRSAILAIQKAIAGEYQPLEKPVPKNPERPSISTILFILFILYLIYRSRNSGTTYRGRRRQSPGWWWYFPGGFGGGGGGGSWGGGSGGGGWGGGGGGSSGGGGASGSW